MSDSDELYDIYQLIITNMLIKKEQSRKKINSNSCIVWEYDFPNKNLWFAVWKINWRFPEKWKNLNSECDEIYYILSWTWILHYDNSDYELNEWDAFFLERGKSYWLEGKDLLLALPTQPSFFPEQYVNIE